MKRSDRSGFTGLSGLELIEEASQFLRSASGATLATYYAGAVPFVLGFLYFWADMSRSPFASRHAAEAALAVTGLFLWMKLCQALFAQRILAQIAGRPFQSWSVRQASRVFLSQAVVQPTGLFLIPFSLILAAPFGWIYAFYQTVTVVDDGRATHISDLASRAWKQASLWPYQNHVAAAVMFLFGVCVFLNWFVVALAVPHLLKMLFGIESSFTRNVFAMLNTTLLAALFGLTYLCVDPLVKVIYTLRSFYGESLKSGEDLKVALTEYVVD